MSLACMPDEHPLTMLYPLCLWRGMTGRYLVKVVAAYFVFRSAPAWEASIAVEAIHRVSRVKTYLTDPSTL